MKSGCSRDYKASRTQLIEKAIGRLAKGMMAIAIAGQVAPAAMVTPPYRPVFNDMTDENNDAIDPSLQVPGQRVS